MYPNSFKYSYNYGDVYGHYKTNYEPAYTIIGKAIDEKTLEEGVVYVHENKMWFRAIKDFESLIFKHNENTMPRFKLVRTNPIQQNIFDVNS